jgi:hypothetical protein
MFVSSLREFPENCAYKHAQTVLLNICTENYKLPIFSLMILKALKNAFIAYVSIHFCMYMYVFISSQK